MRSLSSDSSYDRSSVSSLVLAVLPAPLMILSLTNLTPTPTQIVAVTNKQLRINCVRIGSIGGALDCRALEGGLGFDSRNRTNTQGLNISEEE